MGDGGLRGYKARVVIDYLTMDDAWEAHKALKALGLKNVRWETVDTGGSKA